MRYVLSIPPFIPVGMAMFTLCHSLMGLYSFYKCSWLKAHLGSKESLNFMLDLLKQLDWVEDWWIFRCERDRSHLRLSSKTLRFEVMFRGVGLGRGGLCHS